MVAIFCICLANWANTMAPDAQMIPGAKASAAIVLTM